MDAALGIELDRASEIPVGVQLAWALRARVLAGDLAPGSRLPGVRELAAATGVNTNTIRSVYARLEADGLLRAEQGRGTFVSETVPVDERLATVARRALDEARSAGIDPREVAAALYGRLSPAPAPAPDIDPTDPAARRRALRAEIAALERELADARLARAMRDAATSPPRPGGARLLGEDELRAQRDALAERLAALHAPTPPTPPESSGTATRPGPAVHFKPSFGT